MLKLQYLLLILLFHNAYCEGELRESSGEEPQLPKSSRTKCNRRWLGGSRTFSPNSVDDDDTQYSKRTAHQDAYLWPSLSDRDKNVIRDAFHQISRRTCIKFEELEYKPWYHADRWQEDKPYVVIKKSKKFSGYTDNNIEDVTQRSLIYLSEKALNEPNFNNSRGMVMEQLLRYMGYREEYLRPDAASYIQPQKKIKIKKAIPSYSEEQLQWPFDPESITIPSQARNWYGLTLYCNGRENKDIGNGQRAGLLTRWDAVKLNSMYCPHRVGFADPTRGPCVVKRKNKRKQEFA
ncbi:unnamed protein product [Bursaphelenchus okinawaensis]|uniref:Astacin domain-containing protein n=1 Tax=Bursaphelenchus okinawaensis TaxID=465554 RepID=A0A811K543_9BILA|nr:unnamed protein product [Bursaphelenchus okinawaensis]CAG9091526.1 unnamed protein product [Bursaphelenchus okinawaensis]